MSRIVNRSLFRIERKPWRIARAKSPHASGKNFELTTNASAYLTQTCAPNRLPDADFGRIRRLTPPGDRVMLGPNAPSPGASGGPLCDATPPISRLQSFLSVGVAEISKHSTI
jgi:hypothetical protein